MFDFIYDFTENCYNLWWDSFPDVRLGYLEEVEPGRWRCCPQWQACSRLGLAFMEVKAATKEEAAGLWLESCAPDGEGGVYGAEH